MEIKQEYIDDIVKLCLNVKNLMLKRDGIVAKGFPVDKTNVSIQLLEKENTKLLKITQRINSLEKIIIKIKSGLMNLRLNESTIFSIDLKENTISINSESLDANYYANHIIELLKNIEKRLLNDINIV